MNPKQNQYKGNYIKTHQNQIAENKFQGEYLKSSQRKRTRYDTEETKVRTTSEFSSETMQTRQYLNDERKKPNKQKISLKIKVK